MNHIQSFQHQIQQLRFKDWAIHLTYQNKDIFVLKAASDGLIQLLEAGQAVEATHQIKFYCRTIYIALVLLGGDYFCQSENISSNVKTTLYLAFKLCHNPEQFEHFLLNQKIMEYQNYFQSSEHQQIQQRIISIMGPNFSVSTPYDFANLIDSHPSNLVVKNAVNHLIDFTITIFEARCYSAQEIFVACCLTISQSKSLQMIDNLMESYFQSSLQRGKVLRNLINEKMEQVMSQQI